MTDYPIPDTGLTESTRQMYSNGFTEKYAETFKNFVDEVFRPNFIPAPKPVDHSILLDELAILREKYLNGTPSDEHKFAAAVITAAMAVIIGI
jgi:hypothetical protein